MGKQDGENVGVIRADESYSKQELLRRMRVSQPAWDKMLDDGLLFTEVGHLRWVSGKHVIEHLSRQAKRKSEKHEDQTEK